MSRFLRPIGRLVLLAIVLVAPPAAALAQDAPLERPEFSLSSGTIFTTADTPAIYLTFRNLEGLDFRVYRVEDPVAFLAGLEDPHRLGSERPLVPQDPTLLERIASWKARWRSRIRSFVRSQFSHDYRRARRERLDAQAVVLRRQTTRARSFAQVPLLNPSRLVTSWHEILPRLRDTDVRRIPIETREPGLYVVEAVSPPYRAYTILVVSDIGLVTKAAPGQLLLYAAHRFTSEPAAGCQVQVLADRQLIASGTTDASGLFEAQPGAGHDAYVAIARCGNQVTIADPGGWYLREAGRELVGYVFTDKPIYRPGHTVHVKAFLRWRTHGALVPFDAKEVEVRVSDLTDKVIYRARRPVDEFGGVTADIALGPGVALGDYAIAILHGDESATGSFEVQEYRKPEFEVIVRAAEPFVVQGTAIKATIDARYYFGQPVANGRVSWVAHRQPYYSPLRWSDDEEESGGGYWYGDEQTLQGEARLGPDGRATIAIPTEPDPDRRDYSLRIEARVTDAGGREVSGNRVVHATVGTFLLAASTDRYLLRPGETVTLRIRAVSYQGEPKADVPVQVALQRRLPGRWWQDDGVQDVATATVTTDANGDATWIVPTPQEPGDYRIRARAMENGRAIIDDTFVWRPGGSFDEDGYDETYRYLELIPERRTVAPGETARFLIRGAEFDAHVLVTKEADHVSWRQVVQARGNGTIEVPITGEDVGDVWVNLAFMQDKRLYRAERRVRVPATSRAITVTIVPEAERAQPREPARFLVKAVDATGAPVRAQFALGVIDEAVYGVKPDRTPDPLQYFYRRSYSRVGTQFSREYYFVGYSGTDVLRLAQKRRPYTLADFKADRPSQPQVRKEFPDAIYWAGDIVTNANGEARITLNYPDALTTWRVTARGVTVDTKAGQAIARTTVTKDLIVRPITPRFLVEGDRLTVPVITHNYQEGAATARVELDAANLEVTGTPASEEAEIAPGGDVRLDWQVEAGTAGTASVTARASTRAGADAVELSFPVLPFGLQRETGSSGSARGGDTVTAQLTVPADTNPSARTITVQLAPSLAGSLLGALDFLTGYPYGCTEQTLSQFLPTLIVQRAVTQLGLEPTERLSLVDRQVTAGIARLFEYQHDDGGWGWWRTGENHPFMTAYAVYGLLETRRNGYRVDEWRVRRGLASIVQQYREYPRAVPALKAYMLYVLARASAAGLEPAPTEGARFDRAAAIDEVWNARDRLTPYGRALLLMTLDALKDPRGDELARTLAGEAERRGDLAWWTVDHDPLLEDWSDTSVEATATAVQALAPRMASDPLLEQAVRYILARRQAGAWMSTKATAMAVYGLTAYMTARGERATPVSVDVAVNGTPVRTVRFESRDLTAPDPVLVTAPAREGENTVTLTVKGDGTVYWSATARYFETRTPIARTGGRELAIAREYFTLTPRQTGNRIVYRQTPFDGAAAPGDVLLVKLTIAGASDWRFLLIEDPLPAGSEAMDDDSLYPLERPLARSWRHRRELRDDRVVFFQDGLPGGRVELWYLLKITSPGVFTALPARVTPMYVPEVMASTTPEMVTIANGGKP